MAAMFGLVVVIANFWQVLPAALFANLAAVERLVESIFLIVIHEIGSKIY